MNGVKFSKYIRILKKYFIINIFFFCSFVYLFSIGLFINIDFRVLFRFNENVFFFTLLLLCLLSVWLEFVDEKRFFFVLVRLLYIVCLIGVFMVINVVFFVL